MTVRYTCCTNMVVRAVFFLMLLSSTAGHTTIMLDSLIVTQIQDALAPEENSNAYVVTSTSSRQGFIVDTGSTNNTVVELVSVYQQQVQSISQPPQFVFLTHGHPDHVRGIALLQRIYPSTPIYMISQQAISEAKQWINMSCQNKIFSTSQCSIDYGNVLRALTSPRTQLSFNHSFMQLKAFSNLVKGESSHAGLLGLTTASGAFLIFTGDAITIRSHLFVSNFFENQVLPGSDDALCAWAGSMQALVCELQKSNRRVLVLSGHGPISNATNYVRDVAMNVAWLRALRKLTFNSCNASYVWAEMIRQFPDFGERSIGMNGSLNTHVPANANSVNCNNGSPIICRVYNAPPTCPHLDTGNGDATLACDNIRSTLFRHFSVQNEDWLTNDLS
jgi:hypothetical protein